jgi:hypothetical protein
MTASIAGDEGFAAVAYAGVAGTPPGAALSIVGAA